MTTLVKILDDKDRSCYGGEFDWSDHLPTFDKPGAWTRTVTIDHRSSGWHATDTAHMLERLAWHGPDKPHVYTCDLRGQVQESLVLWTAVGTSQRLTGVLDHVDWQAAWDTETNPRTLLHVAARAIQAPSDFAHRAFVQALCFCVRMAIRQRGCQNARSYHVIMVVEQWAKNLATAADVATAMQCWPEDPAHKNLDVATRDVAEIIKFDPAARRFASTSTMAVAFPAMGMLMQLADDEMCRTMIRKAIPKCPLAPRGAVTP